MVAEPWIQKIGNQVSNNLKSALLFDSSKKKKNKKQPEHKEIIGILSFEVATIISKTVNLHKSLTDKEISRLKNEVFEIESIKNLVSSDESYLIELVLVEKLDDLNHIASVVSRLGKRCIEPALQGFEHVYADIMRGVIDVKELGFLVKYMEDTIRKMERYVNATSNLYDETQVLNELEQSLKKFRQTPHEETLFEQKLIWQRQDVRHLREISLWNQSYDKVFRLLARTICTIYGRIRFVFGDSGTRIEFSSVLSSEFTSSPPIQNQSGQLFPSRSCHTHMPIQPVPRRTDAYNPGHIEKLSIEKRGTNSRLISHRSLPTSFHPEYMKFQCGSTPSRLFLRCFSLNCSASLKLDNDAENEVPSTQVSSFSSAANGLRRDPDCSTQIEELGIPSSEEQRKPNSKVASRSQFVSKSRLMLNAPPFTVGGSALALHYANVIIVIEKLLRYPHLVGEETRDDLYQMLPTSLRSSLKSSLKSYIKSISIYNAHLAHDWKDKLNKILVWFSPLGHNTIRWQAERNLEQQIVTRTNVLLLQTLYFADREKTEASICQLLVGLTYICQYEHQENALLDCESSSDFDDCVNWKGQESYI